MPEHRAARYRQKADECREEAARSLSQVERKTWLTMADEWLALARSVEETAALARSTVGVQKDQNSN
jgi:hypothetical protein